MLSFFLLATSLLSERMVSFDPLCGIEALVRGVVSSSEDRSETGLMSGTQHFSAWRSTAAARKETMKLAGLHLRVI